VNYVSTLAARFLKRESQYFCMIGDHGRSTGGMHGDAGSAGVEDVVTGHAFVEICTCSLDHHGSEEPTVAGPIASLIPPAGGLEAARDNRLCL
jgi:hypothetical protein